MRLENPHLLGYGFLALIVTGMHFPLPQILLGQINRTLCALAGHLMEKRLSAI
jgi:hypothetical protein